MKALSFLTSLFLELIFFLILSILLMKEISVSISLLGIEGKFSI